MRYAQREVLWRESTLERVRKCGRVRRAGHVMVRAKDAVAHYAGLVHCGSIHACTVCSPNIRHTRGEEIAHATARWIDQGNSVYMATFTAPHDLGMRLKALLVLIAGAFRMVISGGSWTRLRKRLGIVGQIRSMEVTFGLNGWHPHLHVLIFVRGDLDAYGLAELVTYLRDKWERVVVQAGYRPPSRDRGVVVERCDSGEAAGRYIAKTQEGKSVGNEMTRSDLKQGRKASRTPFEILDDFRWTGDVEDLARWHEYETATKGHQAIAWSQGLKKLLGVTDRNDEEIADEEIGGDDLALIPDDLWREMVKVPGLPAALLDAAEEGGMAGINQLLGRHGLGPALPPGLLRQLE